MIEVVPDLFLRYFAGDASDNKISGCSTSNLVGDMRGYVELTISPAKLELR